MKIKNVDPETFQRKLYLFIYYSFIYWQWQLRNFLVFLLTSLFVVFRKLHIRYTFRLLCFLPRLTTTFVLHLLDFKWNYLIRFRTNQVHLQEINYFQKKSNAFVSNQILSVEIYYFFNQIILLEEIEYICNKSNWEKSEYFHAS